MDLKKLFQNDDSRAVSPVIGVILMVAITVILAAVIGAFVIGIGPDNDEQAPIASLTFSENSSFESNDDNSVAFTISHDSGDSVEMEDLRIVVRDADDGGEVFTGETPNFGGSDENENTWIGLNGQDSNEFDQSDDFSAGDTITINDRNDDGGEDGNLLDAGSDFTIQVIHEPSDSIMGEQDLSTPEYDDT